MNDIHTIITERGDDIPLLLEQMPRMGLPAWLDTDCPPHGTWQGLSLGWVTVIWLSAIWSAGDHRRKHVEPWVHNRLWTLRGSTGQAGEGLDGTADRLEMVLRLLRDDTRWVTCASALKQHTVRVDDLPTARGHVESTSARGYATVTEDGRFQVGHSKDHRPDLPHGTVLQAVLDPLGLPVATAVVSGERADDPLYLPGIERVQARRGRQGLLSVGDCKRAARATRACIASQGDASLCPLPQGQLAEGELAEALEALRRGEHPLIPVLREQEQSEPEGRAQGSARQVPRSLEGDGACHNGTERRCVVRALRQAKAAEAVRRARVATAKAQVAALNQRGRGRKRFEELAT